MKLIISVNWINHNLLIYNKIYRFIFGCLTQDSYLYSVKSWVRWSILHIWNSYRSICSVHLLMRWSRITAGQNKAIFFHGQNWKRYITPDLTMKLKVQVTSLPAWLSAHVSSSISFPFLTRIHLYRPPQLGCLQRKYWSLTTDPTFQRTIRIPSRYYSCRQDLHEPCKQKDSQRIWDKDLLQTIRSTAKGTQKSRISQEDGKGRRRTKRSRMLFRHRQESLSSQ